MKTCLEQDCVRSRVPRPRLLVAGGCHVNGYPLGNASSFGELAANALGWECCRIAPIGLRMPALLFEYLQANPRPDTLVLQFGNYEVPRPVSQHLRASLNARYLDKFRRGGSSSSRSRLWLSLPPEAVFEPSLSWTMRVFLKSGYAALAQHVDPPLFDAALVRQHLRSLIERLAPYKIPAIVVLSPLPCADHMARRFRLAAGEIFKQESTSANVFFLDAGETLGYSTPKSRRAFDIYADERHLNVHGHQLLAKALTACIEAAHTMRDFEPAAYSK